MKQISITVAQRQGVLADLAQLLGENNINIESIDVEGSVQHGVVTITVDRHADALRILQENFYNAVPDNALLIRIRDEPGSLAKVLMRLRDAKRHIRSLRLSRQDNGDVIDAVACSRPEEARLILADVLVPG